eukprot:5027758-Pleurochrysis_carterae.AAC.2
MWSRAFPSTCSRARTRNCTQPRACTGAWAVACRLYALTKDVASVWRVEVVARQLTLATPLLYLRAAGPRKLPATCSTTKHFRAWDRKNHACKKMEHMA